MHSEQGNKTKCQETRQTSAESGYHPLLANICDPGFAESGVDLPLVRSAVPLPAFLDIY